MLITPQLVTAYSLCPRKAYLLMRGDPAPPPHEYVDVLDRDSAKTKTQFLASCQARPVSQEGIVFDARFLAGELEATVDVMIPRQSLTPKPWQYYEPHLFVGNNVATNEHKITVAFWCKTIEEASGSRPPTGVIVTKNSKVTQISVANVDAILSPILVPSSVGIRPSTRTAAHCSERSLPTLSIQGSMPTAGGTRRQP